MPIGQGRGSSSKYIINENILRDELRYQLARRIRKHLNINIRNSVNGLAIDDLIGISDEVADAVGLAAGAFAEVPIGGFLPPNGKKSFGFKKKTTGEVVFRSRLLHRLEGKKVARFRDIGVLVESEAEDPTRALARFIVGHIVVSMGDAIARATVPKARIFIDRIRMKYDIHIDVPTGTFKQS